MYGMQVKIGLKLHCQFIDEFMMQKLYAAVAIK